MSLHQCSRCGCTFEWEGPAPQYGAGNPPTYCSPKCRKKAAKSRAEARAEQAGIGPSAVKALLASVETALDDDSARGIWNRAREMGASTDQLYVAWRKRYERALYRQPHQPVTDPVMRCLTGKWRYPSRDEAGKTLNTLLRIRAVRDQSERFEQRSYQCDRCDGWHLTSSPTWEETATA